MIIIRLYSKLYTGLDIFLLVQKSSKAYCYFYYLDMKRYISYLVRLPHVKNLTPDPMNSWIFSDIVSCFVRDSKKFGQVFKKGFKVS